MICILDCGGQWEPVDLNKLTLVDPCPPKHTLTVRGPYSPPFRATEVRDITRLCASPAVEEPHFPVVRQEDARHVQFFGVVPFLILHRNVIDARALGLQCRHGE